MTTFTLKNGLEASIQTGKFMARGFEYKYLVTVAKDGKECAKTYTDDFSSIGESLAGYSEWKVFSGKE